MRFFSYVFIFLVSIGLLHCGSGSPLSSASCILAQFQESTSATLDLKSSAAQVDKISQSFQITSDQSISAVDLKLKQVGSLTNGTLTLSITSDTGNGPSTSTLGQATLDVTTVSTTASFKTFTFSESIALTRNTTYFLVLESDFSLGTNYIAWQGTSTDVLSSGKAWFVSSQTPSLWQESQIVKDLVFQIGCQ